MALEDVTNTGKDSSYIAAVVLASRFAPVVRKGVRIDHQQSKFDFPALRDSGATNIDLWLDGNLYPIDPVTGKPLQFQTLKSFLEFLCHGDSGLIGYAKHLLSTSDAVKGLEHELGRTRADCLRETVGLQNSVALLKQELATANGRWAQRSEELLVGSREEIAILKSESDLLRSRCAALEQDLLTNEASYNNNLLMAQQQGREAANQELKRLQHELMEARKALLKFQRKMERMVSTPLGVQLRASKGLSELAKSGGAARARIAKIRSLLQPAVVQSIQSGNKTSKGRKRLCGSKDTQDETGQAIGRLLSKGETLAFVSNPENSFAATRMTNYYLDRIGTELGTEEILAACDMNGVSHKGYGEIYKTIKGRVQLVDKRLKPSFLPNPHKSVPTMSASRGNRSKSSAKGKAAVQAKARESPRKSNSPAPSVSLPSDLLWEAPFNLEGIPTALREKLVLLAPCLLGRAKAVYDAEFFHRVVGLCKDGFLPKEVTESMAPSHLFEDDWPCGEGANKTRYLLDKCTDSNARASYLRMYQRVYGDSPDNKAFSQTFLRACVYYYNDGGRKNPINWAGAATKVTEERQAHPGNNPLKLGPPALKQQLAGIVRECSAYFQEHAGNKHGGDGGRDTSTQKVDKLLKEINKKTADLCSGEKAIAELSDGISSLEVRKLELEAEDESLSSLYGDLRQRSKELAKAGKVEEKALVDKEHRQISKDIVANNDKLEECQDCALKMVRCLEKDTALHKIDKKALSDLHKKCAAERASQYSIKPKEPVGNKVLETGASLDIKVDTPCGCCSLLFVSNTAVPFSCGCLFHPWCLWSELLLGCRICPLYKKEGDSQWLESWSFDVLETTKVNPKPKKEGVPVPKSSPFVVRKREATNNGENQPPPKLSKPKVSIKGPSPLAANQTIEDNEKEERKKVREDNPQQPKPKVEPASADSAAPPQILKGCGDGKPVESSAVDATTPELEVEEVTSSESSEIKQSPPSTTLESLVDAMCD